MLAENSTPERDRPLTKKEMNLVLYDYYNIGYKKTMEKYNLSKPALDVLVMAQGKNKIRYEKTLYHAVQRYKSQDYSSKDVANILNQPLSVINDLWSAPRMFS